MNILLTGGAGFIGSHCCSILTGDGHSVTIVDNYDPFYNKLIKAANIHVLLKNPLTTFIEGDITEPGLYDSLKNEQFDCIIHLAAKAGVRPSIANALSYENTNVKGTLNLLEFARQKKVSQFIFASSSSVYGVNPDYPWHEDDSKLMPISPYAATKLAGEHLGFTYAHLYNIQFTALRFFTVYGPGQRPDLAIHKFFHALYHNKSIEIYGTGNTLRDYTFVNDIVSGIKGTLSFRGKENFNVFNLGGNEPVKLIELVRSIENVTGKKFMIEYKELQPGDVPVTYASIEKAMGQLGYRVNTRLEDGLHQFKTWFEQTVLPMNQ